MAWCVVDWSRLYKGQLHFIGLDKVFLVISGDGFGVKRKMHSHDWPVYIQCLHKWLCTGRLTNCADNLASQVWPFRGKLNSIKKFSSNGFSLPVKTSYLLKMSVKPLCMDTQCSLLMPAPGIHVTGHDECLFHFWHHHIWPELTSSIPRWDVIGSMEPEINYNGKCSKLPSTALCYSMAMIACFDGTFLESF